MKVIDWITKAFRFAPADTRPTRQLVTSGGYTIVLREYITGAENWAIRQVYIAGLKSPEASTDGSIEIEAEAKAFGLVVVSINGSTDDIAARTLALPLGDYNEVAAQVKDIVEAKKKSEIS